MPEIMDHIAQIEVSNVKEMELIRIIHLNL